MFGSGSFDIQRAAFVLISLVIAVTVHEFMHAWTAYQLGDDTAYHLGRISLNPAMHFDPLGFLMFLLIAIGLPAFAWGKPVPVNTYRLRPAGRFGQQGSMAIVALAGPMSNVVLALAGALSFKLSGAVSGNPLVPQFLATFITINIALAAFNFVPVPPLDGYRLLLAVAPSFWRPVISGMERYGFGILLVLIFSGLYLGGNVIGAMVAPVSNLLNNMISFVAGV